MFSFQIHGCTLRLSANFICFLLIITQSSSLSPPSSFKSIPAYLLHPWQVLPLHHPSIWETDRPLLSWCETNTSQRTPDTSHRVQIDVCVCFHASTVSFLRPLDFCNFVCCQKSSTWPSRSPHCMIMSAFVPS